MAYFLQEKKAQDAELELELRVKDAQTKAAQLCAQVSTRMCNCVAHHTNGEDCNLAPRTVS